MSPAVPPHFPHLFPHLPLYKNLVIERVLRDLVGMSGGQNGGGGYISRRHAHPHQLSKTLWGVRPRSPAGTIKGAQINCAAIDLVLTKVGEQVGERWGNVSPTCAGPEAYLAPAVRRGPGCASTGLLI